MLKTRILLVLFVIAASFTSCKKELTPEKQAAKDDKAIVEFIAKNNIAATKHSSGIYYQILSPGTGATPTLSSEVTVGYEGRLLNGSVFDKSKPTYKELLINLIQGWKIGVPLIKKGGSIRLLVPSGLGYGNQAYGSIPKNAVLDFKIDLIEVN